MVICSKHTQPEFPAKVAKTLLVIRPVSVEVHGTVLSPLKHLRAEKANRALYFIFIYKKRIGL